MRFQIQKALVVAPIDIGHTLFYTTTWPCLFQPRWGPTCMRKCFNSINQTNTKIVYFLFLFDIIIILSIEFIHSKNEPKLIDSLIYSHLLIILFYFSHLQIFYQAINLHLVCVCCSLRTWICCIKPEIFSPFGESSDRRQGITNRSSSLTNE